MAVSFRANATVKMQIRQLQTVGSQGLEEFPVVLWAYQAIFWTMREMWEAQWLPYRASLFSPELPSVQCWQAGEFTKAGHLRLGDDHTTSTGHSLSLHGDLIKVIKVLPLRSTLRCKMKFPCWKLTRRLTVYHPTFTRILADRNHDCHLQTDISMKCVPYSVVRTCVCFHIYSLSMGGISSRHFPFSSLEREK